MPLLKRAIQPSYVSRVPIVQEWVRDENGRVFPACMPATEPPQDLEAFTNLTLSNLISQLSSLSKHAEDLFGEMIADSTAIMDRTISLQGRVDKLAVKVKNLDSNVEEVSLQDIHMRKAFKSSTLFDQQVVSRDTVPAAMLDIYNTCDHPPPLDELNPYRDDGKDGLKFYTDPSYFFNLWREEITKETEQIKDNKKKPGKPKGDGRKKNKIRQASNTRDKHKQLAIAKGETIGETGHYRTPQGKQEIGQDGVLLQRPNSIDLPSHGNKAHPPSHHQNDHPTYIANSALSNNKNHMSPHQQQQMAAANGGQMAGYGTAGNFPHSYLNQENFGIYGQTTYDPSAENGECVPSLMCGNDALWRFCSLKFSKISSTYYGY
ncbi:hypothetical protein FHG87_009968 [Trinorchestia longiramus]|nr:hypothetical protein FHG87_009968 [Trinorchestia longiramus]